MDHCRCVAASKAKEKKKWQIRVAALQLFEARRLSGLLISLHEPHWLCSMQCSWQQQQGQCRVVLCTTPATLLTRRLSQFAIAFGRIWASVLSYHQNFVQIWHVIRKQGNRKLNTLSSATSSFSSAACNIHRSSAAQRVRLSCQSNMQSLWFNLSTCLAIQFLAPFDVGYRPPNMVSTRGHTHTMGQVEL